MIYYDEIKENHNILTIFFSKPILTFLKQILTIDRADIKFSFVFITSTIRFSGSFVLGCSYQKRFGLARENNFFIFFFFHSFIHSFFLSFFLSKTYIYTHQPLSAGCIVVPVDIVVALPLLGIVFVF